MIKDCDAGQLMQTNLNVKWFSDQLNFNKYNMYSQQIINDFMSLKQGLSLD